MLHLHFFMCVIPFSRIMVFSAASLAVFSGVVLKVRMINCWSWKLCSLQVHFFSFGAFLALAFACVCGCVWWMASAWW